MGLVSEKILKFERHIKTAMKEWQVPGLAVAIVHRDKIIYTRGFGVKKRDSSDLVNEKTVFQAGSITKSFTAALLSILVDKGKLTWKDKVQKYQGGFKLHDPEAGQSFTVGELLSQCSGLPPHSGRMLPFIGYDRKYIVDNLHLIKPVNAFRKEYGYQNNLFLVAAYLVEKLAGKSWEQMLYEELLRPMGLTETTSSLAGYQKSENVAYGHYYNLSGTGSPIKVIQMNWPHHHWIYTVAPAGGINSNVLNLANWIKLYLDGGKFNGKRIVSEENIRLMLSPHTAAGPGVWGENRYYCKGWLHSDYIPYPIRWHNGGTSGMKNIMAVVKEVGLGIIIMSNLAETLVPEALCRTWFDLWFLKTSRNWSSQLLKIHKENCCCLQDSPSPDTPSRPLRYYKGFYYNELYGPISITTHANNLVITMGPGKITKVLKHWGGDTFVLYWPGVLTNGTGIQFYGNSWGTVDRMKIEGMNDSLTGVFIKKN